MPWAAAPDSKPRAIACTQHNHNGIVGQHNTARSGVRIVLHEPTLSLELRHAIVIGRTMDVWMSQPRGIPIDLMMVRRAARLRCRAGNDVARRGRAYQEEAVHCLNRGRGHDLP